MRGPLAWSPGSVLSECPGYVPSQRRCDGSNHEGVLIFKGRFPPDSDRSVAYTIPMELEVSALAIYRYTPVHMQLSSLILLWPIQDRSFKLSYVRTKRPSRYKGIATLCWPLNVYLQGDTRLVSIQDTSKMVLWMAFAIETSAHFSSLAKHLAGEGRHKILH